MAFSRRLSIEMPMPVGRHFVAGEGVEIGSAPARRSHVGRGWAPSMSARAGAVGHLDDLAHGIDGAQRIGDVAHGHHRVAGPRSFSYSSRSSSPRSLWNDPQLCALLFAQHLPGHDVGVVLERGDDDLVAFLHVLAAPTAGHEVDAFGCARTKITSFLARALRNRLALDRVSS